MTTLTIHSKITDYETLIQIAADAGGSVVECGDSTHHDAGGIGGKRHRIFPCRNDDPGAKHGGQTLVAQGWRGGTLYGVVVGR